MLNDGPLDFIPLWLLFAATVLLVLLVVEGGYRLGTYRRLRSENEKEAPAGAMVGTAVGLLAFLLAIAFGMAADRYDKRREVVLDEANAIGTAYLRTSLLEQAQGAVVRKLLREYVDVRIEAVASGSIASAVRRSEALHNQLWAVAAEAGAKNTESVMVGLFIQALNEVIDLHSTRIQAGVRSRLPGTIWLALYAVAVVALMGMGYHGGLAGTSRSLAILAVALTFSLALWLIADLDRPNAGWLRVSQQPMLDLRATMTEPVAAPSP
jgi:hypothetical protein